MWKLLGPQRSSSGAVLVERFIENGINNCLKMLLKMHIREALQIGELLYLWDSMPIWTWIILWQKVWLGHI